MSGLHRPDYGRRSKTALTRRWVQCATSGPLAFPVSARRHRLQLPFEAPVSGGKNPVPNSIGQTSGVEQERCVITGLRERVFHRTLASTIRGVPRWPAHSRADATESCSGPVSDGGRAPRTTIDILRGPQMANLTRSTMRRLMALAVGKKLRPVITLSQ